MDFENNSASMDVAAVLCSYTSMRVQQIVRFLHTVPFDDIPAVLAVLTADSRAGVQNACAHAQRRYDHEARERERVRAMYALQRSMAYGGAVIGVDEVGRGPLAGPLSVGAVVLNDEPCIWGLNDSKQLSSRTRSELAARIRKEARAVAVVHFPPAVIDEKGISCALKEAMRTAIERIDIAPTAVLIDGNPVHVHPLEQTIVKGDCKIAAIAAASIVAKVERDAYMSSISDQYPQYHFAKNKGYGSSEHIQAIKTYGLSAIHRKSFCTHFVS